MMNKNNKIEELMNLATEPVNENDDEIIDIKNKSLLSKRNIFIISITAVLIISVFATAHSKIKPQDFVDKTKDPNINNNNIDGVNIGDDGYIEQIWKFDKPASIPSWAEIPFEEHMFENKDFIDDLNKYVDSIQSASSALGSLPSGIKGDWEGAPEPFTNDGDKEYLVNEGQLYKNPKYQYALKEDYYKAYANYIQRLINPVFGKWVFFQNSTEDISEYSLYPLKDMFSLEWWNKNIINDENYQMIPIFADWGNDSFGGLEFDSNVPVSEGSFYGEVFEDENNSIKSELLGKDERGANIMKISTPIKYYAYGKNGKIEKLALLELTLASNEIDSMKDYRVVITNANLIIE